MSLQRFQLAYGRSGHFECPIASDHVRGVLLPPEGLADVPTAVERACTTPGEGPPLSQCLVADDRVVVVIDRQTPQADQLLLGLWRLLETSGIRPERLQILQPADLRRTPSPDPRAALPTSVRKQVEWSIHDPLNESACAYLASTAGGERIYLARSVIEADIVLTVGAIGFDEALGFRGTFSAVYPGLSNADAIRKGLGGGYTELSPESPRSLRELADEVGWLLGAHFALQVIPSSRAGVAAVLAGSADAVLAAGRRQLAELWQVPLAGRCELVVAAVDIDAGGHGWSQFAAALDTARRLVARDGRILLLSELAAPLTEGIELIRDAHTPREALRPIRERAQSDRREALQLAQALDRANVYCLSQLEDDLVEELFMIPIASTEEARRLIEGAAECVVLGSAQHAYVTHPGDES